MANVFINENTMSEIGDAIRSKTGKTSKILPADMPNEIMEIPTGPTEIIEQATPTISIDAEGLITAKSIQDEGYVSGGIKTATLQLSTEKAKTITPSRNRQTAISAGKYATGKIVVAGDANLVPQNIQNGITIFGVTGTHSASGNFNMTEVTLASNHSTKEWKTICTIPFVGQNLFNDKLFLMMFRKDTTELTYSIPVIMGCNSAYLNSSYALAIKRTSYGVSVSYKPGAVDGYQLSNPNGKEISRIGIKDSNGDIQIYPEQSYSFEAGTYVVIYGLLS